MNKYVVTYEDEYNRGNRNSSYRNKTIKATSIHDVLRQLAEMRIWSEYIVQIERVEKDDRI